MIIYNKIYIIEELNQIRIFGSILLVVALITSISMFGYNEQYSFFKASSKSLPVQTKSFTNPIIPNQFSFQPVLNRNLVQSESVPIINNSWINGLCRIPQ